MKPPEIPKRHAALSLSRKGTRWDSILAGHGSLDFRELQRFGLTPDNVVDFSANINPYGPSPKVHEAVAQVPLDRHPDRECLALRATLARTLSVSPDQILPGNGVSELIWLVALAFIQPEDKILVFEPTFTEYVRTARLSAANSTHYRADEESGFTHTPENLVRALREEQPQLVFICNPNNPTGSILPLDFIAFCVREFPRTQFVFDEAFLAFAGGTESAITLAADNVVVLRSMTKDYALAGLRLGYAVGPEQSIASMRVLQPPWSVNAFAQAAGVAALGDANHLNTSLIQLAAAKCEFVEALTRLGMAPLPSATHYFLVRAPQGNAPAFRNAQLERRMLIRDCTSFGLPAYVRIAARRPEENARLVAAIKEVLQLCECC